MRRSAATPPPGRCEALPEPETSQPEGKALPAHESFQQALDQILNPLKHLARVQYSLRVKGALYSPHNPDAALSHQARQVLFLGDTDSVLAGNGPAHADGGVEDLGEGGVRPATHEFMKGLRALADEGRAVLVVSHQLNLVARFAGHLKSITGVSAHVVILPPDAKSAAAQSSRARSRRGHV